MSDEGDDDCSVEQTIKICQIFLSHLSDNKIETDPLLFSIVDPKGRNVLHYLSALDTNVVKALPMFVELGAEVDKQDGDGNTPLHYAAMNGNIALYEALVTQGANLKIRNGDHKLPIEVAKDGDTRDSIEVIELPNESGNIVEPVRANSTPQDVLNAIERITSRGFSVNSVGDWESGPVVPDKSRSEETHLSAGPDDREEAASGDSDEVFPTIPEEPEDAFHVYHGNTLIGVPGSGAPLVNSTIGVGVNSEWHQEEGYQDSDEDGGDDDDQNDAAEKEPGGESDAEVQNDTGSTSSENQASGRVVNEVFLASDPQYFEFRYLDGNKYAAEESAKDAQEYERSVSELELELSNALAESNITGDIIPGSPYIDMDMYYVSEDIGMTTLGKDAGIGPMPSVVS